jgi:tRNA uridine 5-carboxymethylaminomethyl modification enzyme
MSSPFDVVVVGLGHAGAEAALAATRMGCRTASITQSLERACLMSCNPAIGGPGKSQLVHELDALGAAMPSATDISALQLRILNRSKGPAIWATRAQVDRAAYASAMQQTLAATEGLELIEDEAAALLEEEGRVVGLRLRSGRELLAGAVVLTTGTFLSAMMHVGDQAKPGGRHGDQSSTGLSASMREVGLRTDRFRTGTPPRLLRPSIDFGRCVEQPTERDALPFSRSTELETFPVLPQLSCFATRTQEATHAIVRENLSRSPLLRGSLTARGPRYCPGLEVKVLQYPERQGHAVYLEPEGIQSEVIYPAGLSTSLPADVQIELLRTIPGLEGVELVRPGYAVEYDYLAAGQLKPSLETTQLEGLFAAGQINGSSGYEEAAGQGLVAGVNAARRVQGRPSWIPDRQISYLGVLCDDLTSKGFEEPYRLLPARAEARLSLREGNAALRLGPAARELGLVEPRKARRIDALREEIDRAHRSLGEEQLRRLRHPDLTLERARKEIAELTGMSADAAREVYLDVRYAPYEAQRRLAETRLSGLDLLPIPEALRYASISGLSGEALDILEERRPQTLAAARALPGVNAAQLAVLVAHLRRRERANIG